MSEIDIFYPNKLTSQEVEELKGWKLKVATLHFGVQRGDCVRFVYGFSVMVHNCFADEKTIHLVADDSEIYKKPIDLGDEIDWDVSDMIALCGFSVNQLCKDRILSELKELED